MSSRLASTDQLLKQMGQKREETVKLERQLRSTVGGSRARMWFVFLAEFIGVAAATSFMTA